MGANKVPANQIWMDAREDLEVSFLLDRSALHFGSDEAPNISNWVDLRTINDTTLGHVLIKEEVDQEGVVDCIEEVDQEVEEVFDMREAEEADHMH